MSVYNGEYKKVGSYKRAKQISGYEYEVEACIKALKEGWLQCPDMPHAETIKMMEWMDELRGAWGIVYPFEKETQEYMEIEIKEEADKE